MTCPGEVLAGPVFVTARSGVPGAAPGFAICTLPIEFGVPPSASELPVLRCAPAAIRAKKSTSPVTPAAPVIETVNEYVQVSPVETVNVGPEVIVTAPDAEK